MLYKSIRRVSCFAIFTCSMIFMPQVHANYFTGFNRYWGMSAGYQHAAFKPGYGDGFFPNHTFDTDLFFGWQKENKFGLEMGVNITNTSNKYSRLNPGDKFPGSKTPLVAGTYQVWNPTYQTGSIYLGINRYHSFNAAKTFRGFVMLGAAWTFIDMEVKFIDDDLPGLPSLYDQNIAYNSYLDSRFIPMLKIGIEYDFGKGLGTRVNYTWKNYASYPGIKSSEYPGGSSEVRLGNTNAIYLGLYVLL